jgi:hypothetical protein
MLLTMHAGVIVRYARSRRHCLKAVGCQVAEAEASMMLRSVATTDFVPPLAYRSCCAGTGAAGITRARRTATGAASATRACMRRSSSASS